MLKGMDLRIQVKYKSKSTSILTKLYLKVEKYHKTAEDEKIKIYIGTISKFTLYSDFSTFNIYFLQVPERLYGEGNIKITGVKRIQVTNDYLDHDQYKRKCQNETTYEDCVTESYLNLLKQRCSCLPFILQNANDIDKVSNNFIMNRFV